MTQYELEQIYYLKRELRLLKRELEREKGSSLVKSPLPRIGTGSGVSDKVGDKGTRIVYLEDKIQQLEKTVAEVFDFIDKIPDSQMRIIINSHCVEKDDWNETLEKVGGKASLDSIKKRYYRFLEKIF